MLVVTNFALNETQLKSIHQVSPKIEVVRVSGDDASAYAPYLDQMEVGFCMLRFPTGVADGAPNLRWVHTSAAGVDGFEGSGLLGGPFTLTTSNGLHRLQMAEYITTMMLMLARNMPMYLKAQAEHRWLGPRDRPNPTEIGGKTLSILSLGNIGDEAAKRAKAFGMRVIGTRRSVTLEQAANKPSYVDELLPVSEKNTLISQADYLLLSLPLTGETRGMLGEKELRSMKPTSFVINISRGAIIDEAAITRALKEGWIAGAALDVFTTEPLPAESPLWDLPNAIITPHVSGPSEHYSDRCVDIFCQNLERYVAGEALLNVYESERGY